MKRRTIKLGKRPAALFLFLCVLLAGCGKQEPEILLEEAQVAEETVSPSPVSPGPEEPAYVWADIVGEIRSPGVYRLESGARIYELVEKAGGFTEEAAPMSVNQARVIQDGEQIRILSRREYEAGAQTAGTAEAAEAPLVNINTATEEELNALTGIGPSKAAAIAAYREENGPFASIEELMEVSGIGEKTFEQLRDEITVS